MASVILVAGCGHSSNEDIASTVGQCELDDAGACSNFPFATTTASADEANPMAIDAGIRYYVDGPGAGQRGYLVFTPEHTGTHTFYFGDAEPIHVCDEDALCASPVTSCGDLHRAAQYAMTEGDPYVIELKPIAAGHPFVLKIVGPAAPPPPPPPPTALKLGPKTFYVTSKWANEIAVGDLNGDAAPEVVVSNGADPEQTVVVMRNSGAGAFTSAATISTAAPRDVAISDFDADGDNDIAVAGGDGHGPLPSALLHDQGSFTFTRTTWTPPVAQYWGPLGAGDFDEDGTADVVELYVPEGLPSRSGFVIHKMPGAQVLQVQDDFGDRAWDLITGDFNGDGHQDVLVASKSSTIVHLWTGNGSGTVTFKQDIQLPISDGVVKLVAVDLDHNGYSDFVALAGGEIQGAAVVKSSATGFSSQFLSDASSGVAAGDFNHDGRTDLITGVVDAAADPDLLFYRGTANGFVFDSVVPSAVRSCCMAAVDLNHDGFVDLVTLGSGGNNVSGINVFLGIP